MGVDIFFVPRFADNGSEFARLQEDAPEAKVYYAHPYTPWERGMNEKQNALVRYFIRSPYSFESEVFTEFLSHTRRFLVDVLRDTKAYRVVVFLVGFFLL